MGKFCTDAADAPPLPGAYVLAVELAAPLAVTLPNRPAASLGPGHYLYCGSARGPGGLRARLSRHMRRGKTIRWHIDRLTETGAVLGAWFFPGGDECELVATLSSLPVPIAGFGSTDCAGCRSHLLQWPSGATSAIHRVFFVDQKPRRPTTSASGSLDFLKTKRLVAQETWVSLCQACMPACGVTSKAILVLLIDGPGVGSAFGAVLRGCLL